MASSQSTLGNLGFVPYTGEVMMVSQSPRVFTTAIAVSVFWIGWVNGSFAATAWGWIALLCSCAVGLAVLAGELRAPRMLLAWGLALSAFVVWTGVSLLWTSDVTTGVQDVQRSLVYVAVAGLAVTFADAATPAGIRNGVLIGSSALCLYGVAAHLLPDVFGVASQASAPGRSFSPLGYWNAQGMLAVLAMILAMGVVSTDGSAVWRAVAAAAVPLLAVQIALTLSRGAELAVVFGVAVWLAIDPRRVQTTVWLVVLGIGGGIAAWQANRTTAMVGDTYGLKAASAGHRLAGEVLVICVVTGFCVYAIARLGRLIVVPPWIRVAYMGMLCAGVLLASAATVQRYGDPARWPRSAYDTLTAAPTIKQDDPSRLSTFSLTNRNLLWSVASPESDSWATTSCTTATARRNAETSAPPSSMRPTRLAGSRGRSCRGCRWETRDGRSVTHLALAAPTKPRPPRSRGAWSPSWRWPRSVPARRSNARCSA